MLKAPGRVEEGAKRAGRSLYDLDLQVVEPRGDSANLTAKIIDAMTPLV